MNTKICARSSVRNRIRANNTTRNESLLRTRNNSSSQNAKDIYDWYESQVNQESEEIAMAVASLERLLSRK